MMSEEEKERLFSDHVADLAEGDLDNEATELQRELLCKVVTLARRQGKADGVITLKISYKSDENGAVDVGYTLSATPPKAKTSRTVIYVTDDGEMQPARPSRQQDLDFERGKSPLFTMEKN